MCYWNMYSASCFIRITQNFLKRRLRILYPAVKAKTAPKEYVLHAHETEKMGVDLVNIAYRTRQ